MFFIIFINDYINIISLAITYIIIYNLSLIVLFWIFLMTNVYDLKTIYSFINFKYSYSFLIFISIALFSMAGIPPFFGFFLKIILLVFLINSNFFFLYIFFFVLLFLGLYFYLQNIRFLFSTAFANLNTSYLFNLNNFFFANFFLTFIVFILCFGALYIDDFFLFSFWLIS